MRLQRFPALTALASLVPDRNDAVDPVGSGEGLLGSWSATRWQYASLEHPERAVDVVCDLGGSVTLSLSEGTFVLTWEVAGQGRRSIGGALAVSGDRLELLARGLGEAESVSYRLAADTLALECETSAWDFDGDGREEPAGFVAVFVRL